MSTLLQQELLEAPPRRRIVVPRGQSSWWGVDPSTRGCAIGWVTASGARGAATEPFPKLDAMARLSVIYEGARGLSERLAREVPPGLILVEQPSGSSQAVNHELEFAVGCIIAGIYDGVRAAGSPARMELVVGSWWKVRACGRGDIRKTHLVDGKKRMLPLEEYEVMQWARLNGYAGPSWDEADSMAIAEAARRDCGLEQR